MNNAMKTETAPMNLVVYSYRPMGALKQRRWAVAKGDRPEDIISTHGTRETACRAADKLFKKFGGSLTVDG